MDRGNGGSRFKEDVNLKEKSVGNFKLQYRLIHEGKSLNMLKVLNKDKVLCNGILDYI